MAKKEVKKENKTDKKVKVDNEKDKKSFAKDFKAELKKVTWPTPKQLVNKTTAVIVSVLVVAAIVFVLDFAFESIVQYGVGGLKAIVTSNSSESENNTVDDDSTKVIESGNTTEESGIQLDPANVTVENTTNTTTNTAAEATNTATNQ